MRFKAPRSRRDQLDEYRRQAQYLDTTHVNFASWKPRPTTKTDRQRFLDNPSLALRPKLRMEEIVDSLKRSSSNNFSGTSKLQKRGQSRYKVEEASDMKRYLLKTQQSKKPVRELASVKPVNHRVYQQLTTELSLKGRNSVLGNMTVQEDPSLILADLHRKTYFKAAQTIALDLKQSNKSLRFREGEQNA